MSGTHRDLLFGSKSRCFACKYHRSGLGPMETSNSDARHAVLLAENHWWGLGPIETCYSCTEVAVLHAETTGGVLDLQRLVILVLKSLFCMHKTTGESWYPYRLFILVQITLFFIHKTTGEVWYPKRLVLLSKSRCFACKNNRWGLGPIEPSNSGANHAGLMHRTTGYICDSDTFYSSPKFAVLHAKTTDEG